MPIYSELPTTLFEAQMRYLKKRYRIVSLDDLLCELADPVNPEPAVAVTFDDGYPDLYREAFPILVKYKVPATIYLTVGAIETGEIAWYDRVFLALQAVPGNAFDFMLDGPRSFPLFSRAARLAAAVAIITWMRTLPDARRRTHCTELEKRVQIPKAELVGRMLTWEQVRSMSDAGVAFGSHTMTHPVVSHLTPADLEWEILESKRILEEKIQTTVADFAYPFGKPDEISLEAQSMLARGAYRSAVTTTEGLNVPQTNPYHLCRCSIDENNSVSMFALRLNRLFLRGEYDQAQPESESPVSATGSRRQTAKEPVEKN